MAALAVPITCDPNARLAGVAVAATMPVPDRDTLCGLVLALSVNESDPVRDPVVEGVNVTLIVQLADAASETPQLFDCA